MIRRVLLLEVLPFRRNLLSDLAALEWSPMIAIGKASA